VIQCGFYFQGRYKIEVNRMPAGNWVLMEGLVSML